MAGEANLEDLWGEAVTNGMMGTVGRTMTLTPTTGAGATQSVVVSIARPTPPVLTEKDGDSEDDEDAQGSIVASAMTGRPATGWRISDARESWTIVAEPRYESGVWYFKLGRVLSRTSGEARQANG